MVGTTGICSTYLLETMQCLYIHNTCEEWDLTVYPRPQSCVLYFSCVIWAIIRPFIFAVVVRELFYNQPVRRKQIQSRHVITTTTIHTHMSLLIHSSVQYIIWLIFPHIIFCSEKRELHHVKKCVLQIALIHPQISIRLLDTDRSCVVLSLGMIFLVLNILTCLFH